MENDFEILWENNKLPATNYSVPSISIDNKIYKHCATTAVLFGTIFSMSIIYDRVGSVDDYKDSILKFSNYQSQIDDFSKDILEFERKRIAIDESIYNFISLNNNWDGYGAIPLTVLAAKNANKFISGISDEQLRWFDDGYPNTHGTISFEWKKNDLNEFFIEVGDSLFSFYIMENGRVTCKGNKLKINDLEFNKMYKLIEKLNG